MRKLLILLALAVATTASAQTHPTGLTFSVGQSSNDVSFRRLFGNQWAALATLGYIHGSAFAVTTAGGTTEADSYSLELSGRRYFAPSDLRPFVEAGGGLRWTDIDAPGCANVRSPFATASGGVEYHIAPRVSIEGTAGLSYSSFSQRCTVNGISTNFSQHSLSTFRSALSLTFYF
jgi:hypothetical protein